MAIRPDVREAIGRAALARFVEWFIDPAGKDPATVLAEIRDDAVEQVGNATAAMNEADEAKAIEAVTKG